MTLLHVIPELRELLGVAANLEAAGLRTASAENVRRAILVAAEAVGVDDRGLGTIQAVLDDAETKGVSAYDLAEADRERVALRQRLDDGTEPMRSADRDLRPESAGMVTP